MKEKLEVVLVEVENQKRIAKEKHVEELQKISAKVNNKHPSMPNLLFLLLITPNCSSGALCWRRRRR